MANNPKIASEDEMGQQRKLSNAVGSHVLVGSTSPSRVPSQAKKPTTRGHSGCVTCRARKVKCDERPNACGNCERLGVECSGYMSGPLNRSMRLQLMGDGLSNSGTTEAGTRRKRLPRSCQACRTCKTKCSGDTPACLRCAEKGIECVYEAGRRRWKRQLVPINGSVYSPGREYSKDSMPHNDGVSGAEGISVRGSPEDSQYDFSETEPRTPISDSSRTKDPRVTDEYSWLLSSQLPTEDRIHNLVAAYFANVHPLRSFGFIYKPSFLEKLDRGLAKNSKDSSLLHIICALGARFYALDKLDDGLDIDSSKLLLVGNAWAETAKQLLFREMSQISVENLMVAVLLHDYQLRVGDYAGAFMLSAITARMTQALQINLEYSPDILCTDKFSPLSVSARESRRRLFWSCYVMDSWVGSGVDQLTLLHERDIKIQLPCNERNFLQQIPCITETISRNQILRFLPDEMKLKNPSENMGMVAQFIRIAELRKKVLRYLKGIDITQSSQLPDTEFAALDTSFTQWYATLPPRLQLTTSNMYIRKESNQLGALFLLHCAYHLSICDLYRIGDPRLLPSLFRHTFSIDLLPAQQTFLRHCRQTCFEHAKKVASILSEAVAYGAKMLADHWLCTAAYETLRILLYYVVKDQNSERVEGLKSTMVDVLPLMRTNMKALKLMRPLFATAERCHNSAISLVNRAGLGGHIGEGMTNASNTTTSDDIEGPSIGNNAPQITPESVLNPLAIYSLARRGIREKHTPEAQVLSPKLRPNAPTSSPSHGPSYIVTQAPETTYSGPPHQATIETTQPPFGYQISDPLTMTSLDPYSSGNFAPLMEQPMLWQSDLGNYSMDYMTGLEWPGLDTSWHSVDPMLESATSRDFQQLGS